MADIELVIKIDEEIYQEAVKLGYTHYLHDEEVANAVAKGTPLPKGHGRLIDADKINFDSNYFYNGDDTIIAEETVNDVPTIIEADKAESEE